MSIKGTHSYLKSCVFVSLNFHHTSFSFKCVKEREVWWKCGENKVEEELRPKRKIEKKDRCFFFLVQEEGWAQEKKKLSD